MRQCCVIVELFDNSSESSLVVRYTCVYNGILLNAADKSVPIKESQGQVSAPSSSTVNGGID
jgi:hypothetical protein